MAAIVWDTPGERRYEHGLDRAVLLFPDGGGVAWNGLASVDENPDVSIEPFYFDGVKFADFVTLGNFSATMRAYTYPDEFLRYEGLVEDQTGFYLANQEPNRFHLTYRTMISDDNDPNLGYKIHLLYNLTAVPSTKSRSTMSGAAEPILFEWALSAIPEELVGYNNTAHIVIDSREMDPWLLEDIEVILYGDHEHEPTAPALSGFASFIRGWQRIIITDHGDGTWTASTVDEGSVVMLSDTEFQITDDNAVFLNADTYTLSSSDKNEEDIWLP